MPLLTYAREMESTASVVDTHRRTAVQDHPETGEPTFWVEWDLVMPGGRVVTRGAFCDPDVAAGVLAMPRFMEALQMVGMNAYAKLAP